MYLKEVRLNGFKSFADPTRLELHPGITAIVGPNGCGKSNISDAIRWVLGEQSTKSLRAGSMADVIFQGATSRKPLNLCEVSLLFTDCEKELGTAFAEVEVVRRVTREGASDYYLNGRPCRLKDLHRLFLDTGVGQVSYSFMLQGQIDKILSSNPAERRVIFEEAAGISKYKSQRREALNKLSQVDANLARVTDVMEEVARQIGSLKRQAAKALRYQRLKGRLTRLELAAAARRHTALRSEVETLGQAAATRQGLLDQRRSSLSAGDLRLTEMREARTHSESRLQTAQQSVYDLRNRIENARHQAGFAATRAADLQRRNGELQKEITQLEDRRRHLIEQAAGESNSRQQQLLLFGDSDQVFQEKNKQLADLEQRLAAGEAGWQRHRQTLLMTESTLTRLRSNCTTLEVDLKTYQVRHAGLADELHRLSEEEKVLAVSLNETGAALTTRQADKEAAEAALKAAQEDAARHREAFRTLQSEIQKADREIARLNAQTSILETLQEKLEGFSEGAKAILAGQLQAVLPAASCAVLTRYLRIEEIDWTPAVEALLGPGLDALWVAEAGQVAAASAELAARKLGRACFQIPVPNPVGERPAGLPEWLQPASAIVTCDREDLAGPLATLLDGCYLVPSLDQFLTYWNAHPGFDFALAATRAGECVNRRGLVAGGAGKQGREASYLGRSGEIKRFKRELARRQKELDGFREQAAAAGTVMEEGDRAIEDRRRRVLETAQEVSTIRAQDKAARESLEACRGRLAGRRRDLDHLERQKAESIQRLEKAHADLAAGELSLATGRATVAAAEQTVNTLRQEREAHRESFNEIRLELSEKRQRLAILDRNLEEMHRQTRDLNLTITRRQQEIDHNLEQAEVHLRQQAVEMATASELGITLEATLARLEEEKSVLAGLDRSLTHIEATQKEDRAQADALAAEINRAEVALARLRSEWDFLRGEIRREHNVDLDGIDWEMELWRAGEELPDRFRFNLDEESVDPEPAETERPPPSAADRAALANTDWEAVSTETNTLRERVAAIGPVNLMAIQEYQELKTRHEFLKTQSEDLWQSKNKLLAAIDEINQTSQALFAETFAQIRKNFAFTFENLFGGGSADLHLIDGEDVLESGIEIAARPPGTRLRSLALLSGGQRTMTAVSLLFAIYMVKPSPFCVLDEIDAPLDDANIGRFCDMLKRFLKYSQFLIITHSKRTISNAHTIFGATMQERGVTKLVSMRFNPSSQQAEAVS